MMTRYAAEKQGRLRALLLPALVALLAFWSAPALHADEVTDLERKLAEQERL